MLSCVTIMYNEELLVGGFIDHIKDVVGEIVLIDGGSTDRSVQIARDLGVNVIEKKQPEDMSTFSFGAQWSFAMDQAKGDWILIIGVDERLNNELKNDLNKILQMFSATMDGASLVRYNYKDGNIINSERHIRIVKNLPHIRFSANHVVHEILDHAVKEVLVVPDKYAIIHDKTTERMERQSHFYEENFYKHGRRG